jgi:transcriptional regulator with XRE-family HTH domain
MAARVLADYSGGMAIDIEIPDQSAESDEATTRLGEVLRRARSHRGYSLRQVEERTGILNAHLSQIERGQIRRPDAALLWRLSELYALNYDLLAYWAGYTDRPGSNAPELATAIRLLSDLDAEDLDEALRVIDRLQRKRELLRERG